MDIHIRDMQPDDCEKIAEIERLCFSRPLSSEGFAKELSNPDSVTLIAEADGMIIGYANLWNICGEVSLNNIAVIEEHRSKGAGTALLQEALRRFTDCEFITLEVRSSNIGAQKLYKKFGFKQVGRRRNFYDAPTEDALLMTRYIKEYEDDRGTDL